jgi:hypothetical protein
MDRWDRRSYRSSVALKIDIEVDKMNAPSAHKIPKNYMGCCNLEQQTIRAKDRF